MSRKAFVEEFQSGLTTRFNSGYQSWWHKFLFHFTDISNIISILNTGKLYSRNRAIDLGLMQNDNADDDVISNTNLDAKDYVRFYFGALTPTQYHNEGFKSKVTIYHNAHCPVPVFLLFDFVELLSKEESKFSSGNIASSGVDIYSNIENLNDLEFENIYHRGSMYSEPNPKHITYCRHAEVLLPNELDIYESLKYIVVRSEAEKQTLLHNLEESVKDEVNNKIRIKTNGLFYANRFYVEKVILNDDAFVITFSQATNEKFDFVFIIRNNEIGNSYEKSVRDVSLENRIATLKVKPEFLSDNLSLRIEIDGHLAHEHNFGDDNSYIL